MAGPQRPACPSIVPLPLRTCPRCVTPCSTSCRATPRSRGRRCGRVGIEPRKLDHRALAELAQPLALQIALFNDVEAAFVLKRELLLLTRAAA